MSASFPEWVARCVHENAPDHSTQVVKVGKLREASGTIAELYGALEHIRELLVAYGPRYIEKATKLADSALAKARGETA
jgi:hypothetical protein